MTERQRAHSASEHGRLGAVLAIHQASFRILLLGGRTRYWLLLAMIILAAAPVRAANETSPEGLWLTDDGKAVVRIASCGAKLCGNIERVLDRGRDVPTTDINNPDPKLRSRPITGLRTLWGFSRSGAAWKGGRAYDPKSGKSYRSTLQLNRDGSLKVSGCVLLFCQSRRWTRSR